MEKIASELAKSAEQFQKDLESALKTNTTIDQPTKDATVEQVNGLKEDAAGPRPERPRPCSIAQPGYARPQHRQGEPYRPRHKPHGVRSRVAYRKWRWRSACPGGSRKRRPRPEPTDDAAANR